MGGFSGRGVFQRRACHELDLELETNGKKKLAVCGMGLADLLGCLMREWSREFPPRFPRIISANWFTDIPNRTTYCNISRLGVSSKCGDTVLDDGREGTAATDSLHHITKTVL